MKRVSFTKHALIRVLEFVKEKTKQDVSLKYLVPGRISAAFKWSTLTIRDSSTETIKADGFPGYFVLGKHQLMDITEYTVITYVSDIRMDKFAKEGKLNAFNEEEAYKKAA